jgi:hypothetical protein
LIARLILIILILPVEIYAQIVFSEVFYNEPANQTSLEWIEIYNQSDTPVDLAGLILISGIDTSRFQTGSDIQSLSYAVLARVLTSSNGESFEGHWGDSSGFWGDFALEDFPAFDVNISLPNDNGRVELLDTLGNLVDSYSWDQSVSDGYSSERDEIQSSQSAWHECTDPNGSTPGKANSPVINNSDKFFNVTVTPRILSSTRLLLGDNFHISVFNSGLSKLNLEIFDDSAKKVRSQDVNSIYLETRLFWDGRDDDDKRMPPGIYIILITSSSGESKTSSVVIAP